MKAQSVLTMPYIHELDPGREFDRAKHIRYPKRFAEHFIAAHSEPGDTVFDPFAGFGSTLIAAEEAGRIPMGFEIDPERYGYIHKQLTCTAHVFRDSCFNIDKHEMPQIDFVMTGPPYNTVESEVDPFSNYQTESTYAAYIEGFQTLFSLIKPKLASGAKVIIEASNMKTEAGVTMQAWDIARSVADVLRFDGEIVMDWTDGYYYGYDHSYALVFTNNAVAQAEKRSRLH